MTDAQKIQRIIHASTPYCDEHHVYHVFDLARKPRAWVCPVCRQESERDEGLDFFGGKATNG